jgi:hypothetical protein
MEKEFGIASIGIKRAGLRSIKATPPYKWREALSSLPRAAPPRATDLSEWLGETGNRMK